MCGELSQVRKAAIASTLIPLVLGAVVLICLVCAFLVSLYPTACGQMAFAVDEKTFLRINKTVPLIYTQPTG